MSDPLYAEPSFRPEDMAKAILEEANITMLPTDADYIAQFLHLKVVTFRKNDLGLDDQVRAYLMPSQRQIGVREDLTGKRRKFSILHEVGHFVLPGHASHPYLARRGIIKDTGKELSQESIVTLEIEANNFAADCIFQVDRFDKDVRTAELNWLNIQIAAEKYDVSIEATARRWIERSLSDCALVVFQPTKRTQPGSNLSLIYTITSPTFRVKYFERLKKGYEVGADRLIYKLFYNLKYEEHPEDILHVQTSHGITEFRMRLFSNSYRIFGIITPLDDYIDF